MQFSLDHKRRSHKQSERFASDYVGLIFARSYRSTLLITTPPSFWLWLRRQWKPAFKNEREISIPHNGIKNFEFIVSERVQVNPDNSRAMSALTFLLFKLNTLQTKIVKLWVGQSHGVMTMLCMLNLHHDNDVKEVVSSQLSVTWYKSANQKIGIRTVYESWINYIF